MATEHINLSDEQAAFVQQMIDEGRYTDINELIRVSVYLLQDRVAAEEAQKNELRAMLDRAFSSGLSDRTPQEIWDDVKTKHA